MYNNVKILHLIAQKPDKTGSGIYLQGLMRQAYTKEYEQALICGIDKEDIYKFDFIKEKYYYPVFFNTKELPFPVVGMSDIMPYDSIKYRELNEEMLSKYKEEFKKALERAITKFKPDVIISHHLWILSAYTKKLYPNIPMMTICHGTDLRQLNLCPSFKDYVINGCTKIDKVLALNSTQKEIIVKELKLEDSKVAVIGSGYDRKIFYPSTFKEEVAVGISDKLKYNKVVNIVYAGKLSFSKGLLSFIKALNKLDYNINELNITLLGSGTGEEERRIKEEGNKCKYKVNFTGAVPQKLLADYFRKADIFVLPSFYEGLPLVVIEALACNLRVIVNDLLGVRSWIGEEINNSGIIEYVKMPIMKKIDEPLEESLSEYEENLKKAMESQISKVLKNEIIDREIAEYIFNMSWEMVFKKIEMNLNSIGS